MHQIIIAGVDEVGRGPLAGPVTAACVVLNPEREIVGLNDSKKISKKKRESLSRFICQTALSWSVVSVGPRRIEQINIQEASLLAMGLASRRVFEDLLQKKILKEVQFFHCLVDGNAEMPVEFPQTCIIGGDGIEQSIGAASILAKVKRDGLMKILDRKYSGYGFAQHSGYPTAKHKAAIAELGACPAHRRTFRGVKELGG